MRNFSIDLIWAKIQIAITAIGGWLGYFLGGIDGKKVLILFMVGIANIVDLHVIGSGSALRGAVIAFYLSNEGLSLLENAAYIGLPIPDKLKAVLEQLHNRDEKEGKDDQGDGK